ncbi:MAG: methyltransferase domain-containing protein [Halieaceae bacterium]|jgi:cyclopropane fatty-acyl-phospholipid synthase-like methyltransferase|nr:methyltransferase domain-containing protein [Halieaceae bacterium]
METKAVFPEKYAQLYPRSSKYPLEWVYQNQMGPNALWLMEWLCRNVTLSKGSRVLDLGCGCAMSSIFLAEEYDLVVWANDLWIEPSSNWERIQARKLQGQVFPIKAEAHALPYAHSYFDLILSVDAYHYFGTSDEYMAEILKFLKPKGQIGIVVPGFVKELPEEVPDYLAPFHEFHTLSWWKRHWEKTGLVRVDIGLEHPDGWQEWLDFLQVGIDAQLAQDRDFEDYEMLLKDRGEYMGFIQLVATKL